MMQFRVISAVAMLCLGAASAFAERSSFADSATSTRPTSCWNISFRELNGIAGIQASCWGRENWDGGSSSSPPQWISIQNTIRDWSQECTNGRIDVELDYYQNSRVFFSGTCPRRHYARIEIEDIVNYKGYLCRPGLLWSDWGQDLR